LDLGEAANNKLKMRTENEGAGPLAVTASDYTNDIQNIVGLLTLVGILTSTYHCASAAGSSANLLALV
jgi:hypothetical protein